MEAVANYANEVREFLKVNTEAKALSQAKKSLADDMKDPSSAQFRNVKLQPYLDGYVICGEVNAKNSYGAYVGYTRFVASTTSALTYEKSKYPSIESSANAGLHAACGY